MIVLRFSRNKRSRYVENLIGPSSLVIIYAPFFARQVILNSKNDVVAAKLTGMEDIRSFPVLKILKSLEIYVN